MNPYSDLPFNWGWMVDRIDRVWLYPSRVMLALAPNSHTTRNTAMTTTYETYWNAVLGERDAASVVSEFSLVADGLDEWLGTCETEAARMSEDRQAALDAWAPHHERALLELTAATVSVHDIVEGDYVVAGVGDGLDWGQVVDCEAADQVRVTWFASQSATTLPRGANVHGVYISRQDAEDAYNELRAAALAAEPD